MIKKIIVSLLIGFFITLWLAQEDPWVTEKAGNTFKNLFASSLDCSFSCRVKRVNFFVPSIELEDVEVRPLQGDGWVWKAKKYDTVCTWSSILGARKLDLHITMQGLEATTGMDSNNQPAIMAHLKRVIAISSQNLPIMLSELNIIKGSAVLRDPLHDLQASLCWTSEMTKGQGINLHLDIHDGAIEIKKKNIDQLQGNVEVVHKTHNNQLSIDGTIMLHTNVIPESENNCSIEIKLNNGQGIASIKNNNHRLKIDPITVAMVNNTITASLTAQMPLTYLTHIAGMSHYQQIQGDCTAQLVVAINDHTKVQATVSVQDITYNTILLSKSFTATGEKFDEKWHGTMQLATGATQSINGLYEYNEDTGHYLFSAHNINPIVLPLIQVPIEHASVEMHGTLNKGEGTYECTIGKQESNTVQTITGSLALTPQVLTILGHNKDKEGKFAIRMQPTISLQGLWYGKKNERPLLHLKENGKPNSIDGSCDFSLVRQLVMQLYNYDIQGHGIINCTMALNEDMINAHVSMLEGTIRLPHTYNFVTGFEGTISGDWKHKKGVLKDVQCTLHRGSISCDRATLLFNDNADLVFAHVPLLAESCLLNIKRDLFAQVSAFLLITKTENNIPLCKGDILVERGHLQDNIFAHVMPRALTPVIPLHTNPIKCACDITIATREPVHIETPFLQTNARLTIHMKGTLEHPTVTGSVTISGGCLNFPYKPLFISKGNITFQHNQLSDPLIELVAHNSMRNYRIGLQVSGSGTNPLIHLTATPTLSEEQIIALLLTGQPEGSLNMVMPSLVMQNIKSLLFDIHQDYPHNYFAGLLKPLRHIKVIPRFSDQTARGGIRGALEIELGERWHATIQNNFSLSEDTRLDLEYLASDNIAIRGFRSEQRDVGGEVEMRWKW